MLFDDLNKVDIPAAWPNEARYFIPGPYLLTHRQQRINQPERARQTPSLVHRSDFQSLSTSSRPERPHHPKTQLAASTIDSVPAQQEAR